MAHYELPPELEDIERMFMREPRPEPGADLRWRILCDVSSELSRMRNARIGRWILGFAAIFLVGLGISWGAILATQTWIQPNPVSPSLDNVADRLQQISPNLTHEESLRQAGMRHITIEAGCPSFYGDIPKDRKTP
jgi:hypothetical protein